MQIEKLGTHRFACGIIAFTFCAIVTVGSVGATSNNTDLSDIWWNPNESGWGMQMVNTGTFVFATIYVYGVDGKPTWYTGQLDYSPAANVTYTGPLYVTSGPYFGGPFNPTSVGSRQVGTMTFTGATIWTGQLSYSVDGVVVNKAVQRQSLKLDNYNGVFSGVFTFTNTQCNNPASNGNFTTPLTITTTQNGQAMSQVWTLQGGSVCTLNGGKYSQLGRAGQFDSTISCTSGNTGVNTLYDMNVVPYMFTARVRTSGSTAGCITDGEVVGVIPR